MYVLLVNIVGTTKDRISSNDTNILDKSDAACLGMERLNHAKQFFLTAMLKKVACSRCFYRKLRRCNYVCKHVLSKHQQH